MTKIGTKLAIFELQQSFSDLNPSSEMASATSNKPISVSSATRASSSTRRSHAGTETTEIPPTEEQIDRKPWKYIGYKGYAEFIASDNDFYIVRQFASLNARVTVALQDQVCVLEAQLDEFDKGYSRRDAEDLHNGWFRDDRGSQ